MLGITARLLKGIRCITVLLASAVCGGVTVGSRIRKPAASMSAVMCLFGQQGGVGACV